MEIPVSSYIVIENQLKRETLYQISRAVNNFLMYLKCKMFVQSALNWSDFW